MILPGAEHPAFRNRRRMPPENHPMTGKTLRISADSRWRVCVLAMVALLNLAACASGIPPRFVASDRMNYAEVIADSLKRQTLLNVVRLRYADTPVFLEVASIINSYSVTGRANAGGGIISGTLPTTAVSVGGEGSWSNTPTVTYQPLMGDRLSRSLLQPVPPAAVFQLLQGGWSADLVLTTVAVSINGLRNDSGGIGEDPDFRHLVEALSRIQKAGGLGVRVETRAGVSTVKMALPKIDSAGDARDDSRLVRNLLRLDKDADEFEIASSLIARNGREVAVVNRSMLEIMLKLGDGIDLPAKDVADGRVSATRQPAADAQNLTIARIHSGIAMPAEAYAAAPYKGHWYWIDDRDYASKRIFTFLLILFSLAETNPAAGMPMVTVPSR